MAGFSAEDVARQSLELATGRFTTVLADFAKQHRPLFFHGISGVMLPKLKPAQKTDARQRMAAAAASGDEVAYNQALAELAQQLGGMGEVAKLLNDGRTASPASGG